MQRWGAIVRSAVDAIVLIDAHGRIDGLSPAAERPAAIAGINPLNGTVTVLHKADGVYFLAAITDTTNNNGDALNIRFDIQHNASDAPYANDFGVEIHRNGQATWGAAHVDPSTSAAVPGGTVGVTTTKKHGYRISEIPNAVISNGLEIPGTVFTKKGEDVLKQVREQRAAANAKKK